MPTNDYLHVLYQAVIGSSGTVQLPTWQCREPVARGQLVPQLPDWSLPRDNVHTA